MALKFVDDVDGNGFDDELSTTEIAYLAKSFRNNNNVETMPNIEILGGMISLR